MARKTFAAAAAMVLVLACCSGAQAARALKQDADPAAALAAAADPAPAPETRTTRTPSFTFTFAPKLVGEPELDLTGATLAPKLGLSVTPLKVSATQKLGASGTFSPGASVTGSGAYTPGTASTTVKSAAGPFNGNTAFLNAIIARMQQGAALRQQAFGQLGGGGLLNALG